MRPRNHEIKTWTYFSGKGQRKRSCDFGWLLRECQFAFIQLEISLDPIIERLE